MWTPELMMLLTFVVMPLVVGLGISKLIDRRRARRQRA
jgi:hypothetical protein